MVPHLQRVQDEYVDTAIGTKTMIATYKKKVVSFAFSMRIKPTLHRKDYTNEEARATWYSEIEKAAMLDDVRSTIDFMANKKKDESSSFFVTTSGGMKQCCSRGLEFHRSPDLWARRRQLQVAARNAVFVEQEYQELNGMYNEDQISSMYKTLTQESQIVAVMFGASDEKVARRYHSEDNDCRRQRKSISLPIARKQRKDATRREEDSVSSMLAYGRGETRHIGW